MSAYFLRADAHAICACIQAFHLNDLLFSVVRLDGLFACWQDPSSDRRTTLDPGMCPGFALCHISLALMGWYVLRGITALCSLLLQGCTGSSVSMHWDLFDRCVDGTTILHDCSLLRHCIMS